MPNSWELIPVKANSSLYETLDAKYGDFQSVRYLQNAFSYYNGADGFQPVGLEYNSYYRNRKPGTASVTWNSFVEDLYKYPVPQFNSWWKSSNSSQKDSGDHLKCMFDVTGHHSRKMTIDWPCWVNMSYTKYHLDVYDSLNTYNSNCCTFPGIRDNNGLFNSNSVFLNSGWYCIVADENSFEEEDRGLILQIWYNSNSNFVNVTAHSAEHYWHIQDVNDYQFRVNSVHWINYVHKE